MSKQEKAEKTEAEKILEGLGRGEGIPTGWAYNPLMDPPVFKIEETTEESGGTAEN